MIVARAPLRISFGGGGTDLATYYARYGGLVVSTAITRYCYVVISEPRDHGIHLSSADYQCWETYPRGVTPPVAEPLALAKAAIEWFVPHGLRERGADIFLASEVPPGTGLGSSSAMAVALGRALATYTNVPLDARQLAEWACQLEIERLGMPIGKQDQYASAYGGLNTIEFTVDGVAVTPLDLLPHRLSALSSRLLLFATGHSRESAQILRQQRHDSETNPAVVASLHRIKALATAMREALLVGNLDRLGRLLDHAWREKKRLSGKISTSDIDHWYSTALAAGALGGKITGAGGGGFLLLYCPPRHQTSLREAMARCGLAELPFALNGEGVELVADVSESGTSESDTKALSRGVDNGPLMDRLEFTSWREMQMLSQQLPPSAARKGY